MCTRAIATGLLGMWWCAPAAADFIPVSVVRSVSYSLHGNDGFGGNRFDQSDAASGPDSGPWDVALDGDLQVPNRGTRLTATSQQSSFISSALVTFSGSVRVTYLQPASNGLGGGSTESRLDCSFTFDLLEPTLVEFVASGEVRTGGNMAWGGELALRVTGQAQAIVGLPLLNTLPPVQATVLLQPGRYTVRGYMNMTYDFQAITFPALEYSILGNFTLRIVPAPGAGATVIAGGLWAMRRRRGHW